MTTAPPIPGHVDSTRAATMAALGVTLLVGLFVALVPHPGPLDPASYGGGWSYVVNRQAGAPAPFLNTDAGVIDACDRYAAEGMAQLDGYPDTAAFQAGCRYAAATTNLERVDR